MKKNNRPTETRDTYLRGEPKELDDASPNHSENADKAFDRLAALDGFKAKVVALRFYRGLSVEETAESLQVSDVTVMREWRLAKTFLIREMKVLDSQPRSGRAKEVESQPQSSRASGIAEEKPTTPRPPFNAEYVLYLLLREDEREAVLGDLIETFAEVNKRFNKRCADIWFYKQVIGSLWPLLRRAALRIGALVALGRVLRRLIS